MFFCLFESLFFKSVLGVKAKARKKLETTIKNLAFSRLIKVIFSFKYENVWGIRINEIKNRKKAAKNDSDNNPKDKKRKKHQILNPS